MKVEIEARKKIQTEGSLEMENLRKVTGTTNASIIKKIQRIQEENLRHTKIETGTSVKENVNAKISLKQSIDEIWIAKKTSNHRLIGKVEGKEFQLPG